MIFAVDFDGTIVKHEFPKVGPPVPGAIEGMRELVEGEHQIILYTMRSGEHLDTAIGYMAGINIPLLGVNHNPEQSQWTDSPKAFAHRYIDDSAVGCPLIYPEGSRPYVDWKWVMVEIRAWLASHFCQRMQTGGTVSKETLREIKGRERKLPAWAGPPMGTIDVVPDSGEPLPRTQWRTPLCGEGRQIMSKHTQGPWRVETAGDYYPLERSAVHTIKASERKVAEITTGYADSEANARLIAAAPETLEQRNELLEALEKLVRTYDMESFDDRRVGACIHAKYVIAKAKGGS